MVFALVQQSEWTKVDSIRAIHQSIAPDDNPPPDQLKKATKKGHIGTYEHRVMDHEKIFGLCSTGD
jgi:hypothetical protein